MWTSVISISEDGDEDIGVFNIEFDLAKLADITRSLLPRRGVVWAPLFLPTTYAQSHPDLSLDGFAIGEKRMRILGIEVSKLREGLRSKALHLAKAEAHEQERDIMDISRLARRISRGDFKAGAQEKQLLRPDITDMTAIGARRRSKRRKLLTASERIEIVHRVLILFEKHADVAKVFRVSQGVVAQVMLKAKRRKGFLQELTEKRD
ncbi:MAG: hypothetical protein E4G89_04570 [Methanothrix sp.]|nr:MAG: hypothetical protein E4G89_04570 [Methanothrix sp.]